MRRRRQTIPTSPTEYPAGTFLETEKGFFFIANQQKRYRLISVRVLNSWAPARVTKSSEAALKNYRIAAKMKFRNGSLIHNLADGKIYLIVDGQRCHVTSPDVLDRIGAVAKEIVTVSESEIKLHTEGTPLS